MQRHKNNSNKRRKKDTYSFTYQPEIPGHHTLVARQDNEKHTNLDPNDPKIPVFKACLKSATPSPKKKEEALNTDKKLENTTEEYGTTRVYILIASLFQSI